MESSSGVTVNDNCIDEYNTLKIGKKTKYIIFCLNPENTQIIVEKTSQSDKYEEFLEDLPEKECRWAVYDLEFEKPEGGRRQKLIFYSWAPDDAKIKAKMVFASSKDALRRALLGISVEIQGTDPAEVAYEAVLEKANKGN